MKLLVTPLALAISAVAFCQGPSTLSGSLFNDGAANGLLSRRTALRKGDLLTIVVNEVVRGQYTATTTNSKTDSATVDRANLPLVDVFASNVLGSILGSQAGTPQRIINGLLGGGSTNGTSSQSGTGTTTTQGSYTATITVVVKDVDARGNLIIEGIRSVQVNKEIQKITLTGIVRQDDVTDGNTVKSEKIANADIRSDGKGAIADRQRKGILNKIMDWLF